MRKLLLDTNIVLGLLKDAPYMREVEKRGLLWHPNTLTSISVVTVGEIRAIAYRNGWGERRLSLLAQRLSALPTLGLNDDVVEHYAQIDAFSQGKLKGKPLEGSARRMGKNDLWIAATASVTGSTLVTTDKDFDHLDGIFFDLFWIDQTAT